MATCCIIGVQRTCVDKILALGECPPKDLKIGEGWGPEVLNLRFFSFLLKDPDTQMTCKHPKLGLILDAINTSFVSSLLFYSIFLNDIVVRRA